MASPSEQMISHSLESTTGRRFSLLVAGEGALGAVLILLFVMHGLVPGWRILNTDFPNYYLTAALRLQAATVDRVGVDRVYEWIWFQRHKDHREIAQPLVGFVPNPPLCAAPILPIASLPALGAKRIWIVFNLALLAASLWIMRRVTRLPWRHLLLVTSLCVIPLRTNFMFGQYYVVILFLLCVACLSFVRGHPFTAGNLLAAAGWLKLFPAVFLLLFLRKREWRAIAGLLCGTAALGAASVLIFGFGIHQVWFAEVLPRALRGDLVGPYALQWSSFTSLWHRLFLFEPELNPSPLVNSAWLYAAAQALTGTLLLFAFLFSTSREKNAETTAWEWSAFVPLLLLLSSMPGPYHYCVLIFSAILGVAYLAGKGEWRSALLLGILYAVACASLPAQYDFALRRVLATFLYYVLLIWQAPARAGAGSRKVLAALATVTFAVLIILNLRPLRHRAEDFRHRLPANTGSYASANPVTTKQGVVSIEMFGEGYRAVNRTDGKIVPMPSPGVVLSLAASDRSPFVYFERADQRSHILRLGSDKVGKPEGIAEYFADGQQPAISSDGHWLAFLTEDHGESTIWRSHDGAPALPVPNSREGILEIAVTDDGDIIAAAGEASNPHLAWVKGANGETKALDIKGALRYPTLSSDATLLAFSRREGGSWHLFVRELATGQERQLTRGDCNATSPVFQDRALLYATDCGRGLGLSAIARIDLSW